MKTINILFLGGGTRVSIGETFLQAGISLGYNVHIYVYDISPFVAISAIATIIKGKKWDDINLKNDLISKIEKHNINIVIPFVDIATVFLSELIGSLKNCFVPISSFQLNQIMFDKNLSNQFFLEKEFKIPRTDIIPPLIAKPLKGSGGKGNFLIKDDLVKFKK